MKDICLHESLTSHLEVWAAGSKLAVGVFFFWKPGTAARRSIQGLFRGLLFSVLEKSPDLISTAFPELWYHTDVSTVMLTRTLEHREVLQAFGNLLQAAVRIPGYKFAFFIDGLDEFEGRHLELLQELSLWMESYPGHVKCCVSSREYSIFQEHLSIHPTMRLHKLTERDIGSLVGHRLGHIPEQLRLNPSDIEHVQKIIVEKAEGVFLWVSLVLGSVEDGLSSGDSISEVVGRITHCPVELEALFESLLKSIHPADRKFAFSALRRILYLQCYKDGDSGSEANMTLNLSLVELPSLESTENDLWALQFNHEIDWEVFIQEWYRKVYGRVSKSATCIRGLRYYKIHY